jgi:hypothetical protein
MSTPARSPQNDRVQRLHRTTDSPSHPANQGTQPDSRSIEAASTTVNGTVTANEQEGTKVTETVTSNHSQENSLPSYSSFPLNLPFHGVSSKNAARIDSSPTASSAAASRANVDFDDINDATFRAIVCRDVHADTDLFNRLIDELERVTQARARATQFDKKLTAKKYRRAQLTRGTGEFEYRGSRWIWTVVEVAREKYELRLRFQLVTIGTRMSVERWWP